MAEPADILDAAVNVLSQATGLRATGYIPESINPPAAFAVITGITFETFGMGSMDLEIDLVVLVARSRAGQLQLAAYQSQTGQSSVWLAIAQNKTLGLNDGTDASIQPYRSLGVEEIAAYGFVGGAFPIVVTT